MSDAGGMIMIGAACGLVLLIAAVRSRTELLVNFVLRAVLGTLSVYFINLFLAAQGLAWEVGIGAVSIVVSGLLGIPGVLLLYGISICRYLMG